MYFKIKRFFDIVFSAVGIVLFALPIFVFMIVISATSAGSPIFKQKRIGREGKTFVCFKLRTMYIGAPQRSTAEFADAGKYITPIGRFLRRTSLDELPQLVNVLRGDMSIIGPRPLIPEEGEVHEKRAELGVYRLRPGITGLAQGRGRDMASDDKKVLWDYEYLEKISFITDIKIAFLTLGNVMVGKNISMGKDRSAKKEKKAKG